MKIMVSENVTHFHEVDLSEELDVEQIIEMANRLKKDVIPDMKLCQLFLKLINKNLDLITKLFQMLVEQNVKKLTMNMQLKNN